MLVVYLRSSSVGTYEFCPTQFLFSYVLGWEQISGKKAQLGNAVHKALEILAREKLAIQNGQDVFVEEETGQKFRVGQATPELALVVGYGYYSHPSRTVHQWTERDFFDCSRWLNAVLTYGGGAYDPRKRKIVAPELYFDITIDAPWAAYDYRLPDGTRLQGQLALRGTTDLVVEIAPGVLEMIDWKTGRRIKWNENRPKEYDDFAEDFQLNLYAWALHKLFPDSLCHVTIFYAKDGGPFSLPASEFAPAKAERLIRRHFEEIRDNNQPAATKEKWRCGICSYQRECPTVRGELLQLGMEAVVKKHAHLSKLNQYGSGGGRSAKEKG